MSTRPETARRWSSLLLAVLLLGGCSAGRAPVGTSGRTGVPALPQLCAVQRPVDPAIADTFIVHGCVADVSGRPVKANVYVLGEHAYDPEQVASLKRFGACLRRCVPGHLPAEVSTTAQGQFSVSVPAIDQRKLVRSDTAVIVVPSTGLVVWTGFQVLADRSHDIMLQPVVAWGPSFQVAQTAMTVTPHFTPLPGTAQYELISEPLLDGEVTAADGQATDLHLIPPHVNTLTLRVRRGSADYYSPAVPIRADHDPVSTGAPCEVMRLAGNGQRVLHVSGNCALTGRVEGADQDVFTCSVDSDFDCTDPRWRATVDLGRIRSITDIVLEGCGMCAVWVSTDNKAWTEIPFEKQSGGVTTGSTFGMPPTTARYVQVAANPMATLQLIRVYG